MPKANMSEEEHVHRARTHGGHIADSAQPALPVYHRRLANPSPLGLLSFATGKMPQSRALKVN